MRQTPPSCPKCKQPNIHNLDYCAVCGMNFGRTKAPQQAPQKKGGVSKDQKLKLKRAKKRKELTELFKRKKITVEQYSAGLRKLGYATNADKAAALKKYIREQIKTFEEMKLDPNAPSSGSYYDPNESQTDLPRDEYGNVIVDFTASPAQGSQVKKPTEDMVVVDHGDLGGGGGGGPRFGTSLFGDRRPSREERVKSEPVQNPKMFQESESKYRSPRKIRALADWDEEEEEEEEILEEEMEEEFEGESGWWDDEGWSLEWTDEDEDKFDDFEMDLDDMEEEEEGWILEFDDDEDEEEDEDTEYEVEFDDDDEEEEEDDIEFEEEETDEEDETSDIKVEFDEDDEEEEEEDDDWGSPRRRRRRNR